MITPKLIYERIKREPFVPLRIVTHSGDHYDVRGPNLVLVGEQEIQVGLTHAENTEYYYDLARVSLSDIKELLDLPPAKTKRKK